MKLSQKQQLFTKHVAQLIQYIYLQGYSCTFGDAYRPPETAQLYAQQGKGIKDSLHCKRLAVDLNLFSPDGDYIAQSEGYGLFGKFWESLDKQNRWGGKFPKADANHFQRNE